MPKMGILVCFLTIILKAKAYFIDIIVLRLEKQRGLVMGLFDIRKQEKINMLSNEELSERIAEKQNEIQLLQKEMEDAKVESEKVSQEYDNKIKELEEKRAAF